MNLTSLQNTYNRDEKRVGRGGKRGKTSGHGQKGQKQHGRHGIRPAIRDFIKKLPKLRGFGMHRSRTVVYAPDVIAVNLGTIDQAFQAGETVSIDTLAQRNVVPSSRQAAKKGLKVLAHGDLTKKLHFEISEISTTAREKIEQSGGTIVS